MAIHQRSWFRGGRSEAPPSARRQPGSSGVTHAELGCCALVDQAEPCPGHRAHGPRAGRSRPAPVPPGTGRSRA